MQTPTLAEKTQAYWIMSSIWYGRRPAQQITTELAIKASKKILETLNPEHPLTQRVDLLLHSIIHGTPYQQPNTKQTSNNTIV